MQYRNADARSMHMQFIEFMFSVCLGRSQDRDQKIRDRDRDQQNWYRDVWRPRPVSDFVILENSKAISSTWRFKLGLGEIRLRRMTLIGLERTKCECSHSLRAQRSAHVSCTDVHVGAVSMMCRRKGGRIIRSHDTSTTR